MDSLSFREDVAAVAPDFLSSVHLKNSPPHNSLDSTDSNKSSARVQDDTDGLVFARASNGCLWLCDANTLSPMENNQNITKADLMTMSTPPHLLSAALETSEDGQPLLPKRYFNHRNSSALQKEREERVRKIREAQEEERNKKIDELKSHAAQQQKFREIQEVERRKRFEDQRARDSEKFIQVEERRRAIESAERERRGALLKKNQEREGKIFAKKKLTPMQAASHTKSKGRSPSAMSTDRGTDTPSGGQNVKLRPGTASHRRPRPISIATTGVLSASMYEKRSSSSNANTPTRSHHITATGFDKSSKHPDMKSKRPVTKSTSADHKDAEEFARPTKTPSRKTPAQVKAESAARKAKANTKSPTPPLKKQHSRESMEKNSSNSSKESSVEKQQEDNTTPEEEILETEVEETSVEPSNEEKTGNTEVPTETHPVREATPDIIRKSPVKEVKEIAIENIEDQTPKKNMISSEATEQEQAKMRIAEKRREMKEKKEKEAELERQKQAEIERIEAERLAKEEEEG